MLAAMRQTGYLRRMNSGATPGLILRGLDSFVDLLARSGLSHDFIRFGIVGTLGFVWDTATVYAVKDFAGLYVAGACGFVVAATINWAINRFWTFRHLAHAAAHRQLLQFLAVNSIGFIFNRGTFFTLVTISLRCREYPVLAIIAGSVAGLIFNYFLSKKFVFK
jgi:putative flippase GtrA